MSRHVLIAELKIDEYKYNIRLGRFYFNSWKCNVRIWFPIEIVK